MSKIDELIAKLCPEGVEWKSLKSLFKISRGRVISKDYLNANKGVYPVYSSQTINNGIIGNINTFDYEGEFLSWTTDGANAGTVFYRNGKFSVTNVCGLLKTLDYHVLNPKFAYYCLSVTMKDYVNYGMGNPKLMSNVVEKITIPIPPLPVQEEIVRILDKFTALEAELEAELEARKHQYEYYRNQLLAFEGKEVEWKTLGELYDFKNGLNKGKEFFGKGTPIVNFTDVFKNRSLTQENLKGKVELNSVEIQRYNAKANDLFFTRTSEVREEIGMASVLLEDIKDCVFSGFVLRARPKTSIHMPKFISYYLTIPIVRNEIIRHSSFTTRGLTSGPKLSKIKLPILSLKEQERIVAILDQFDALVNDISIGLPAEIKARREQYEYYRGKLLTFQPLVHS